MAFPTIVSKVFHEFGVFVSEVNPSHVWDAEIRDQNTSYAANSGDDECPPSESQRGGSVNGRIAGRTPNALFTQIVLYGSESLSANGCPSLPDSGGYSIAGATVKLISTGSPGSCHQCLTGLELRMTRSLSDPACHQDPKA
jgi:hypothetical protein